MRIQLFPRRAQEMRLMKTKIEFLEAKLQSWQSDDALRVEATGGEGYVGNYHKNYKQAVREIDSKYKSSASWGCLQTGAIIDLRATFIISSGIKVVKKAADADREVAWIADFLSYNDLDHEVAQEFAKEAEIEGKILLKLALDKLEPGELRMSPGIGGNGVGQYYEFMPTIRFISWLAKDYVIDTDPQDYLYYTKAHWTPTNSQKEETLGEAEFIYKKFGGRVYEPNNAQPKIMKCLTQIDNLDKALRDWREINRLFAAPTPHIECETADQAKAMNEAIETRANFKIKKFFAHTGKFSYASPDMAGVASLENEIISNAKMISGTTGVPVHFLGLPDLLSNRATADNLTELIFATTIKERDIWKGAYKEAITKAMKLYNDKVFAQKSEGAKLDPTKIDVEIPVDWENTWMHLEKVFVPLGLAGKISDELLLKQIPGIDVEAELKKSEDKAKSEEERLKAEVKELQEKIMAGVEGRGNGQDEREENVAVSE